MTSNPLVRTSARLAWAMRPAMIAVGVWMATFGPVTAQAPLGKITLTMGGDGFQFVTQHLAMRGGFFKQEGLDAETLDVGSGPRQVAALMGGSSEISALGLIHIIKANSEGARLVAVSTEFDVVDIQVVLSTAALAKSGIVQGMGIDEKVRRLAGLKLAISSPGSTTDTYLRNLMRARGHDPDKMATIQPMGGGSNMLAALEKGVTDGFAWGAPQSQLAMTKGTGRVVINPFTGEVPEIAGIPYLIMATSRDTLERKPEVIKASVRALTRAMKFAQDRPAEAKALVRQHFAELSETVFDAAWEDYRKGIPKSPAVTQEQFDRTVAWLKLAGPVANTSYATAVSSDLATGAAADILGR